MQVELPLAFLILLSSGLIWKSILGGGVGCGVGGISIGSGEGVGSFAGVSSQSNSSSECESIAAASLFNSSALSVATCLATSTALSPSGVPVSIIKNGIISRVMRIELGKGASQ